MGDFIEQAAFKICLYQWKKEILLLDEHGVMFGGVESLDGTLETDITLRVD